MINIGIIGCGNISNVHMKSYMNNPNVKVIAVCDINNERAKKYSEKYDVPNYYDNHHDLLKNIDVDAVSVCTWNNSHAEITIDALNSKKHVLCEKPLAMNTKEAMAMENAAKVNNKLLMVGFVRRFGRNASILKDFANKGFLGDIYYAKTGCLRRNGNPTGWFSDITKSGGGPLIDLGVHMIDLCRYIMGKPMAVKAFGVTNNSLGPRLDVKMVNRYSPVDKGTLSNVEDFAKAMVTFENGAVLSIEVSFSMHIKEDYLYCELYGTKAGATIEPEFEIISNINGYNVDITPKYTKEKSFFADIFQEEINHFIDCLVNDATCINPVKDGVDLMKILDAIYESAKTNCEVSIK
ncbi:MAG: Gfo/Idh/MocA family oxidoreductase [Clostridiales bacterium]|nr:Gfo/Idh/MocA family oxidoreductase [Clostridiales bacterium]